MSPLRTLFSCGISSSDVRRSHLPTRVTRGSTFILKYGPLASFRAMSDSRLSPDAANLYLKLAGRAVSGFATVILLELVIGSLLMISLGVIGEYLARIYEEVKRRPRYVVMESINTGEQS